MTPLRCIKCNRRLKRATASGMGRVCELAAFGSKPKRERVKSLYIAKAGADERQLQLELACES